MFDPHVVAAFWWGLLGVAVLLTFVAVPLRSWHVALLSAICSLACAMAALASFGVLILILTGLQLVISYLLYRVRNPVPGSR
jgi:hypothetical protein